MTYNVFGVTLNLTQSINQTNHACNSDAMTTGRSLRWCDGYNNRAYCGHTAILCDTALTKRGPFCRLNTQV